MKIIPHRFVIAITVFTVLSLALGIIFTVLKSNNDANIETKKVSNNYSNMYLALSIIFYICFAIGCLGLIIFYIYTNNNSKTQIYKPLMSYDTSKEASPKKSNEASPKKSNEATPIGISTSYMGLSPPSINLG